MKAMILGAGKGTRVRPLTNVLAKPMLPILDVPVMEIIIHKLKASGFNEIVINTSYLSETIEEYFKDGSAFGVSIQYSFEGTVMNGIRHGKAVGSAAGMKKIQDEKKFFDDTFMVICGDAIIDADFEEAVRLHKKSEAISSILLNEVPMESVSKYGVVELDKSNTIVSFQEKPTLKEARSNLVNTGIYIFEPEIFEHIPSGMMYDIGGDLFPDLVNKNLALNGINIPFQWIDIGTVEDYYAANIMALKNEINYLRFRENKLHINYSNSIVVHDYCTPAVNTKTYTKERLAYAS